MTYFHLCYLLFDLHCSFNFLSVLQNFSSHFLHSFPAAQPVLFKTQLQNLERQAGESASLCCETTKPGASVIWRCGGRVLASSSKYHLKQEGTVVELVIYKLQGADSGEYSCDTGSQRTSAILTVQGRIFLFKTFFVVFFLLMHRMESHLFCVWLCQPFSHKSSLKHEVHQQSSCFAAHCFQTHW